MDSQPAPPQHLSLWDAISIIVGIVIGTGIYETPPLIFSNVPGPGLALGVWAIAGVLVICGALCYAELATTYPRLGGDYVYLSRAYGAWAGFLFGWAQLTVILTGSIGMLAYVFADYAVRLLDPQGALGVPPFVYAFGAVAALTALNLCGVVLGTWAQNVLTAAKVLGLGGILLAGFLWPLPEQAAAGPATEFDFGAFRFALVLVFLTYGGWNDAACVTASLENRRRNIPLALVLGTAAIVVIYLLINAAYLNSLGFEGVRKSRAVAADVLQGPLGDWGARAMSMLVMVSALGAVNGLIFTGSRIYSALGAEHSIFAPLGRWHPRLGVPVGSLLAQGVMCLLMIVGVGTDAGRAVLSEGLDALGCGIDAGVHLVNPKLAGLPEVKWDGRNGFELLLQCTAPVFWLFFLMTGVGLFILRVKDAGLERPFAAPLFPVVPLVFVLTCAYMVYSGITYAGKLGLVGGILTLAGLPLYLVSRRRYPAGEVGDEHLTKR